MDTWAPVADPRGAPQVPPDAPRQGAGPVVWHVVLGLGLGVYGLLMLFSVIGGFVLMFAPDSALAEAQREGLENAGPGSFWFNSAFTLLIMGALPLAWCLGTRVRPWQGTQAFLGLSTHRIGRDILWGLAITVIMLVGVASMLAALEATGVISGETDENAAVDGLVENLTWPLAIFVALAAGIGEEILFRGLLQRWLGWWPQGVLFGLAHAAGGFWPQVVFSLALGLAFGWLRRRGWSLWPLIIAHFLYDAVLLGGAILMG